MIQAYRVILVTGNLGWRDCPLDARKGGGTEDKIIPLSAYPSAYTLSPFQCSCLHLCSLNHNDLSSVCCCVPDLHPYTTVLGELSQTMHQNFQQAVSNIFTKLRGNKIYVYIYIHTIYYLFFIYLCPLFSCKMALMDHTRNISNKCNLYQTT